MVVMRFVSIYTLLLILINVTSCRAQEIFRGEYIQPNSYLSGEGITYHFTDSSFTKTTYAHLGVETIAKGSYKVSDDTLLLHYRPLKDPSPSYWEFTDKDSLLALMGKDSYLLTKGIKVQFRSVNKQQESLRGTNLAVRNKKEEVVTGFGADSLGYFPNMFFYGGYIEKFHFSFIGKKPVTIKADTLRGYKADVKIILSDSQIYYSDYDGTKKYLIKRRTNDRIELRSFATNEKIVLEKNN